MRTADDARIIRGMAAMEGVNEDPMGIYKGGLPYDFKAWVGDTEHRQVVTGAALEDDHGAGEAEQSHDADDRKSQSPIHVILTFKDGVFRISLPGYYCDDLESRNNNIVALCIWLRQYTGDHRIEISSRTGRSLIGKGGGHDFFEYYVPLINAIRACKGNTVYIVDHILSTYEPYLALAAKDIEIREMSGILLNPDMDTVLSDSSRSRVRQPYFDMLLDRGAAMGILTQTEVEMCKNGRMVSIANTELLARIKKPEDAASS